jgi:hypothetical protein
MARRFPSVRRPGRRWTVGRNGLREVEAPARRSGRAPDEVAQDELHWREIQEAFTLDRTISNLNNGNSSESAVVHEAFATPTSRIRRRYYRGMIERNMETIRRKLATVHADPEEIAITRNASESLQIAQDGLISPGDGLTTHRTIRGCCDLDQRQRRDKIKVTRIQFPVPTTQDDLYKRLEAAVTPQTKVLHICHVTNITGQLFPVQRLCRMARQRGITSIVDAAHSVADFPFKLSELECDFAGTSLHKWLLAPHGTGLLHVRKDKIASTWPAGGRRAAERQHPQVRADRHEHGRRRRRSAKRSRSTRRLGARTRPRAAISDAALGQTSERSAAREDLHEPRAGQPGPRLHRYRRHRGAEVQRVPGTAPHHRPGHGAGRVSGAAHDIAVRITRMSTRCSRNSHVRRPIKDVLKNGVPS